MKKISKFTLILGVLCLFTSYSFGEPRPSSPSLNETYESDSGVPWIYNGTSWRIDWDRARNEEADGLVKMIDANSDLAVVIVAGQSNAAGAVNTGTIPVLGSLPNVKFVRENETAFQDYLPGNTNVFSNLNSNNYSTSLAIASQWQARINGGAALPDLHIINVSRSSTGFDGAPAIVSINDRYVWRVSGRDPSGGPITTSGFDLFKSTIPPALKSLVETEKRVVLLGLVWIQGESDCTAVDSGQKYAANYSALIEEVRKLTTDNLPVFYTRMRSETSIYPGIDFVNSGLDSVASGLINPRVLDAYEAPNYDAADATIGGSPFNSPLRGVFEDGVHYNEETIDYFASYFLKRSLDDENIGSIYSLDSVVTPDVDSNFVVTTTNIDGVDNGIQNDGGGLFSKSVALDSFDENYVFNRVASGDFRYRVGVGGDESIILSAGTPGHGPAADAEFFFYNIANGTLRASTNMGIANNAVVRTSLSTDNYLLEISRVSGAVNYRYSLDAGSSWVNVAMPVNYSNTDNLTIKLSIFQSTATASSVSLVAKIN